MSVEAGDWLEHFAARLGVAPPTPEEQELVLALAGLAAHASERTAAPISCWLAARAGTALPEANRLARELAKDIASG
jgi:Domain of unknown function (DUF6457)